MVDFYFFFHRKSNSFSYQWTDFARSTIETKVKYSAQIEKARARSGQKSPEANNNNITGKVARSIVKLMQSDESTGDTLKANNAWAGIRNRNHWFNWKCNVLIAFCSHLKRIHLLIISDLYWKLPLFVASNHLGFLCGLCSPCTLYRVYTRFLSAHSKWGYIIRILFLFLVMTNPL